jgi:hypothetical protein
MSSLQCKVDDGIRGDVRHGLVADLSIYERSAETACIDGLKTGRGYEHTPARNLMRTVER